MDYYKYQVSTKTSDNDLLIALMSLRPFDTFVEEEQGFAAYLPVGFYKKEIDAYLESLKNQHPFTYSKEYIKGRNWNEEWEANFKPIQIGRFCGIRAGFHGPMAGVKHELVITPKMAFGTGHHETTSMVIELMEGLGFTEKKVLDYGCGTGVLAILASKLGAPQIDAIDIEEASYLNTLENCETNSIHNVNAYHGTLDKMQGRFYGIVLANINRNVILDSLPSLTEKTERGGTLVFSGFVCQDLPIMEQAFTGHGLTLQKTKEKNKWMAVQCVKK